MLRGLGDHCDVPMRSDVVALRPRVDSPDAVSPTNQLQGTSYGTLN